MAEWKSRLPRISAELAGNIDAAMAEGAYMVAEIARQRVPIETGALRAAIHVERNDQGQYSVIAGNNKVFYGHIVEHGGIHHAGQPFLVPALEDARPLIDQMLKRALPE